MGVALWGYCLGPSTGKNCCHCYFQYKYSHMSGMRQFLSVYCFGWINDFFGPLFFDPQVPCTGRDQAAMRINYSWLYLKTIRSSNLVYLFSWINRARCRPNWSLLFLNFGRVGLFPLNQNVGKISDNNWSCIIIQFCKFYIFIFNLSCYDSYRFHVILIFWK